MEDASLEPGRPSLIFFAAAGDLNSSRQALRVVELYRRLRSSPLKFIIIDVDRLESASQRRLVKDYYRGYIPQLVMLTGDGKVSWSHVGEVEVSELKQRLKKVL